MAAKRQYFEKNIKMDWNLTTRGEKKGQGRSIVHIAVWMFPYLIDN
jgi:hypothetical protein